MSDDFTVLRSAAGAGVPLHLIALRREARVVGTIGEVESDGLTVTLPGDHGLVLMDLLSASFSLGGRTWSFLTHVRDLEGDAAWLSAPTGMVSADQRIAPRIAVREDVEVELLGAHPEARPRLVDLAVTGMQVSVSRAIGVAVGERLPAVLRFEGREIELVAELRREAGMSLGFFFPESIRRGRLHPPAGLAALVERVRRA